MPRLLEDEISSDTGDQSLESLRGTETILLVEDQPHLLALSCEFLERLGYRVLTAASGEDALELVRTFFGNIDLLLTDVIMPGMNGRQLALQLKQHRANLKVLYVSGFTDQAFSGTGSPDCGDSFLEKPFELEELAQKIRSVLKRAQTDPA